jgi:hypothetical protein
MHERHVPAAVPGRGAKRRVEQGEVLVGM